MNYINELIEYKSQHTKVENDRVNETEHFRCGLISLGFFCGNFGKRMHIGIEQVSHSYRLLICHTTPIMNIYVYRHNDHVVYYTNTTVEQQSNLGVKVIQFRCLKIVSKYSQTKMKDD